MKRIQLIGIFSVAALLSLPGRADQDLSAAADQSAGNANLQTGVSTPSTSTPNSGPPAGTFKAPPTKNFVRVTPATPFPNWRKSATSGQKFFDGYRAPKENPATETSPKFDVRPLGWGAAGAQKEVTFPGKNQVRIGNGYVPTSQPGFKGNTVNPELRGPENTVECGIRCTYDKSAETKSFGAEVNKNQVKIWETLLDNGDYKIVIAELGDNCIVEEQSGATKDLQYAQDCLKRYKLVQGAHLEFTADAIGREQAMIAELNTDSAPASGTGSQVLQAVQFENEGEDKSLHPQTTYLMTSDQIESEVAHRVNGVAAKGTFTSGEMANWARVEVSEAVAQHGNYLGNYFSKKIQNKKVEVTVAQIPGGKPIVDGKALNVGISQLKAREGDIIAAGEKLSLAFKKNSMAINPKSYTRKALSRYDWVAVKMARQKFIAAIEGKGLAPSPRRNLSSTPAQLTATAIKAQAEALDTKQIDFTRQADQRKSVYTVTMDPADLRRDAENMLR